MMNVPKALFQYLRLQEVCSGACELSDEKLPHTDTAVRRVPATNKQCSVPGYMDEKKTNTNNMKKCP